MNAEALDLLEVNQREIDRLESALAAAEVRIERGTGGGGLEATGGDGGGGEIEGARRLDEAPEVTSSSSSGEGVPHGERHLSLVADLEAKLALAEERAALAEEKLSSALAQRSDADVHVPPRSHAKREGGYMHGVEADEQVRTLEVTLKNLAGGFATRERELADDLERVRRELRGTQHVLGTLQETRLYAKETVKSMTEHLVNVMIELEVDPEETLLGRPNPGPGPTSSASPISEPPSPAPAHQAAPLPPPPPPSMSPSRRGLGSLDELGEGEGEDGGGSSKAGGGHISGF